MKTYPPIPDRYYEAARVAPYDFTEALKGKPEGISLCHWYLLLCVEDHEQALHFRDSLANIDRRIRIDRIDAGFHSGLKDPIHGLRLSAVKDTLDDYGLEFVLEVAKRVHPECPVSSWKTMVNRLRVQSGVIA